MRFSAGTLVEPLVLRIEGGHGYIDDLQLANGAVATAGLDENGRHGFHRKPLSIQFHFALALQNEINLGELLVIVAPGILLDVHQMNRGDRVVWRDERPPCETARTTLRIDFIQLRDHVVGHKTCRHRNAPPRDRQRRFSRAQMSGRDVD